MNFIHSIQRENGRMIKISKPYEWSRVHNALFQVQTLHNICINSSIFSDNNIIIELLCIQFPVDWHKRSVGGFVSRAIFKLVNFVRILLSFALFIVHNFAAYCICVCSCAHTLYTLRLRNVDCSEQSFCFDQVGSVLHNLLTYSFELS